MAKLYTYVNGVLEDLVGGGSKSENPAIPFKVITKEEYDALPNKHDDVAYLVIIDENNGSLIMNEVVYGSNGDGGSSIEIVTTLPSSPLKNIIYLLKEVDGDKTNYTPYTLDGNELVSFGGNQSETQDTNIYTAVLNEETSIEYRYAYYSVTIDSISELKDGTSIYIQFDKVIDASSFYLNVNNLGDIRIYNYPSHSMNKSSAFMTKVVYNLFYSTQVYATGGGRWHCLNMLPIFTKYAPAMGIIKYTEDSRLESTFSNGVVDHVEATALFNNTYDETTRGIIKAEMSQGIIPVGVDMNGNIFSYYDRTFTGANNGLVPKAETTDRDKKYLRADGTWAIPESTGSVITIDDVENKILEHVKTDVPKNAVFTDTDTTYNVFDSLNDGLVPKADMDGASKTKKYLRADGTWEEPSGGGGGSANISYGTTELTPDVSDLADGELYVMYIE